MATNNNITATVNGITFENLTIEQAQALAGLSVDVAQATTAKPKRGARAAKTMETKAAKTAHADKIRSKHDAILDSKRVERMTQTAIGKLAAQGFECKARKQGKWMWVYPTNGAGRTPEFKAAKLPKGWKHSMKRGAYYRDFS